MADYKKGKVEFNNPLSAVKESYGKDLTRKNQLEFSNDELGDIITNECGYSAGSTRKDKEGYFIIAYGPQEEQRSAIAQNEIKFRNALGQTVTFPAIQFKKGPAREHHAIYHIIPAKDYPLEEGKLFETKSQAVSWIEEAETEAPLLTYQDCYQKKDVC